MCAVDEAVADCQYNQRSIRPAGRVMFCGRCGHATGGGQGHFYSWCKRTKKIETPHFCCKSSCALVDGEEIERDAECHPRRKDIDAWAERVDAERKQHRVGGESGDQ